MIFIAMNAVSRIEKVLSSGVLIPEMLVIPDFGATESEIHEEESNLPRQLSHSHKSLIKKWNGMNLDLIRIYGCGKVHPELNRLSERQSGVLSEGVGNIVFADDPAGFMYAEKNDGSILSVQVSTGEVRDVAKNIDDFFVRLVFGKDARDFGGDEWVEELVDAGIL